MIANADRQRLAAILGMLGSDAAGERDSAARQAERMRRELGMTWAQLLVRDERPITWPQRPPEPPPQPPAQPPAPPAAAPQRHERRTWPWQWAAYISIAAIPTLIAMLCR